MKTTVMFLVRVILITAITAPLTLALAVVGLVRYPLQFEPILMWNKVLSYAFWDWMITLLNLDADKAAQVRILREVFSGSGYTLIGAEVQVLVAIIVGLVLYAFMRWRRIVFTALVSVAAAVALGALAYYMRTH